MKPFVAILHNGMRLVDVDYLTSMLAGFYRRDDIQFAKGGDPHIGRGPNKMSASFLLTECDRFIIIDGDLVFTRSDVDALLSHPLETGIVTGLYPKADGQWCICPLSDDFKMPTSYDPANPLLELKRAGRGFCSIPRAVFEAMIDAGVADEYENHGRLEWDFWQSGVRDREYLCENWWFMDAARDLGFKTYADLRIQLGHVKTNVLFGEAIPCQSTQAP